jgi:hypothetical protein
MTSLERDRCGQSVSDAGREQLPPVAQSWPVTLNIAWKAKEKTKRRSATDGNLMRLATGVNYFSNGFSYRRECPKKIPLLLTYRQALGRDSSLRSA